MESYHIASFPHARLRLSESSESRSASSGAGIRGLRLIQVHMENADERVATGAASIGSSMKWCRGSRLVLRREGGRTGHYPGLDAAWLAKWWAVRALPLVKPLGMDHGACEKAAPPSCKSWTQRALRGTHAAPLRA